MRVNNVPIDMIEPEVAREVILAPLEIAGELNRKKIDITVRVSGGGFMGQIICCSYCHNTRANRMD